MYRAKYNGTLIVQRSIDIGEPVIWVAVNYRSANLLLLDFNISPIRISLCSLHVFGFLGGREVQHAGIGNLGLQDRACSFTASP